MRKGIRMTGLRELVQIGGGLSGKGARKQDAWRQSRAQQRGQERWGIKSKRSAGPEGCRAWQGAAKGSKQDKKL